MSDPVRMLCFGDVVGRPGRTALAARLGALRASFNADMVVVNSENAAGGLGIDASTAEEILAAGADVITLGDHAWQQKDFRGYINQKSSRCIRPANYPSGAPGLGWTVHTTAGGLTIGIMNLMGRVFMGHLLDCPFKTADLLLDSALKDCKVVVCDMHAEASSEKMALGRYLDGRVSLLFGTHTHVQTADNHIMPAGTAYITDLGMCGAADGVIGMDAGVAIARFVTALPHQYKIAGGPGMLSGVYCEIDPQSGKALEIERIWELVG